MLAAGVAWVVTCVDECGEKRWMGIETSVIAQRIPVLTWDYEPTEHTIQHATWALAWHAAEEALPVAREGVAKPYQIEEVELDYFTAAILVIAAMWDEDTR